MKVVVLAAALLGTFSAQASNCTQSVEDIAIALQANREIVFACEIRQVLAAQERHVELTGGTCEQGSGAKLVEAKDQSVLSSAEGNVLQSKITIVNSGEGQPADTYTVQGVVDVNGDCKITAVKLAPLGEGLPSPVAQPYPYKQHPSQKN